MKRLALAMLLLSACGTTDKNDSIPPVADVIGDPEGAWDLTLPERWTGKYRVDSLSAPERGRGLPGAFIISYLPSDTTIHPQVLMGFGVYDSATWHAVSMEEGPPPGDSLASHAGRVYVIGLPQSNPFEPGSADAVVFDMLALRPAEISGLIRFR